MIITKMALPRRTVLRGLGAALALPLLDSMVPAFAKAQGTPPVRRLGVVYVPNGVVMKNWTPASEGALEIPPTLEPLAPFKDRLLVLSGLNSKPPSGLTGANIGVHARAGGQAVRQVVDLCRDRGATELGPTVADRWTRAATPRQLLSAWEANGAAGMMMAGRVAMCCRMCH